jgi:uncharacterized repeat protein (TIGR03833 family)
MNGQNRTDVKIGVLVDIVLKKDQRTGALTRGHVKRILANSPAKMNESESPSVSC